MARFRNWVTELKRFATQPLLLAQVVSSLAGAGAMLLAAAMMPVEQFTYYTLISLVSITATGAVRAGLFQPALIELRNREHAYTPFRQGLLAGLGSAALATAVISFLHPLGLFEVVALTASGVFPVLHDWVRFRAMQLDHRTMVFWADALRLILIIIASPLPTSK